MQRCAPEVKGDKPDTVVFVSNSTTQEAEAGGSEAFLGCVVRERREIGSVGSEPPRFDDE